jgi:hypothetical protein
MHTRSFGPAKLSTMYGAFDDAMRALGDTAGTASRDDLRSVVGICVASVPWKKRSALGTVLPKALREADGVRVGLYPSR